MTFPGRRATPSSLILERAPVFLHKQLQGIAKGNLVFKNVLFPEGYSEFDNYFKWASFSKALIYKLVEACLCSTVTK